MNHLSLYVPCIFLPKSVLGEILIAGLMPRLCNRRRRFGVSPLTCSDWTLHRACRQRATNESHPPSSVSLSKVKRRPHIAHRKCPDYGRLNGLRFLALANQAICTGIDEFLVTSLSPKPGSSIINRNISVQDDDIVDRKNA